MAVENSAACDQQLGTCADHIGNCLVRDSAIDLNAKVESSLFAHPGELGNFVQNTRDELLLAKAWIYRHHKHQVHHVEDLGERLDRSGWIDYDSRLAAMLLDQRKRPIQVHTGFLMHRDPVRAGGGKVRNELI